LSGRGQGEARFGASVEVREKRWRRLHRDDAAVVKPNDAENCRLASWSVSSRQKIEKSFSTSLSAIQVRQRARRHRF
jgi:hypothetical protein